MKQEVTIEAPAKINWLLRVGTRRTDGYHDIETIFQTISLHDTLRIRRAQKFSFRCDDPAVPVDQSNLVVRAHQLLDAPPVEIELTKRIPAGGGLGGGSSDAAAMLRGLVEMFDLAKPNLPELALELGSDVPFFLKGGTAYATGRGEKLRSLPSRTGMPLLLALPQERIFTVDAYRWLDESRRSAEPAIGFEQARAMVDDGLLRHASKLVNDLEPVVFNRYPNLRALKEQIRAEGAVWVVMSGSGSTIAGAFQDRPSRDSAIEKLRAVRAVAAETI